MSILITSVLNSASDRLALSLSLSSIFGALICPFIWAIYFFLSWQACYLVRGGALGIHQGGATPLAVLWCCMWGRGQRGNNATCLALGWPSVTSPTTHKQIGPFWCWFPGEHVCVCSRALWVSPMSSPVRLRVFPTTETPTGFYCQKSWGFISLRWNPGFWGLSLSPVVPPGLSARRCGTTWSTSHCVATVLSTWAAHLYPSTGLDECFFFNSFVVWLPYGLISGSSSYSLFLNLLVPFCWLCKEAKCIYLCLHLGWKS